MEEAIKRFTSQYSFQIFIPQLSISNCPSVGSAPFSATVTPQTRELPWGWPPTPRLTDRYHVKLTYHIAQGLDFKDLLLCVRVFAWMYVHASHGYSVHRGLKRDQVSLLVLGTEPWSTAKADGSLKPGANSSLVRFLRKAIWKTLCRFYNQSIEVLLSNC